MLMEGNYKQIWYGAAVRKITELYIRKWWDKINSRLGLWLYFPKASETWLITKKDCNAEANYTLFTGTGVNVTTNGRRYLRVAIGSREYVTTHTEWKVKEWVKSLARIATTQPFLLSPHGLMSKWTYISHTID